MESLSCRNTQHNNSEQEWGVHFNTEDNFLLEVSPRSILLALLPHTGTMTSHVSKAVTFCGSSWIQIRNS